MLFSLLLEAQIVPQCNGIYRLICWTQKDLQIILETDLQVTSVSGVEILFVLITCYIAVTNYWMEIT